LGIYTGVAGIYKFKVDLSASSRTGNVFLVDTKLDTIQDLFVNAEYTFSSEAVEDTSRFILQFFKAPIVKAKSTLNTCFPNLVDLTAVSVTEGSDAGLTYTYWTNRDASIPCSNPAAVGSGAYYIKGSAANGIASVAGPVHVIVNDIPVIAINNPPAVQAPATVDLTAAEITTGSTEGLVYSYWSDAQATIPYPTPKFATEGQFYIKGTVEATGCYSISKPVHVSIAAQTTGIDIKTTEQPEIYAIGNLVHLKNCTSNSIITIYDMIGRRQFSGTIASNHEVIDPGLKTGNYLIQVLKGERIISKKIYLSNGNH
jgi:hypothetical protein